MNANPIYPAQGGGRLYWRVTSSNGDYSDQLASISGLCKRVDYNGGLFFGAATIQIAGGGILPGDREGSTITISMVDGAGNILTGWGDYTITAIDVTQKSAKITAEPVKKAQIPEDYNLYEYRPWQLRRVAVNWLNAAMGGQDTVASWPAHAQVTTNHPRTQAKGVPPASTLKGLCGLVGPSSNPASCVTRIQLGTEYPETSWTSTVLTTSAPPAYDMEMDFCPQKGLLTGKSPLYWHYFGSSMSLGYFTMTGIFRDTSSGQTPSSKCQFPLGVVQYLKLSAKWHGPSTTTLFSNKIQTAPSEIKELTLSFETRAEAKQYLAESAEYRPSATPMSPFGKSTRQGTTADGGILRRSLRHGGKTVTISNYAVYSGIAAQWYSHAQGIIGSGATMPSSVVSDNILDYGDGVAYSTSAALIYPNPDGILIANVHFIPQEATSDWQYMAINSYSDFRPGYKWEQDVYPVTIAQDYTTRAHYCEACMLSHMGFYQNHTGLVGADLCRETGLVYGMPLTISTVVAIDVGQAYPHPKEIWINFRDQYGVNRSYKYTDSYAWLSHGEGDAMTIELCQGVIQPAKLTTSGTRVYTSLNANNWAAQPAMRGVCLHGADWSSGAGGINTLASNAEPQYARLQGENRTYSLNVPNYGTFTRLANYGIRTPDGATWRCFLGDVDLNFAYFGNNDFPNETNPLVDSYMVAVYGEANLRVYSINENHHSWVVQTTMAFASAEPGDVVAVQLPQLFDGQKLLATVLAVEVDSNGLCKLDIVPMHIITADDYTDFTNLGAVMP